MLIMCYKVYYFLGTSDDGGYHEMMSKLRSHHPTKNHPLFPILEYTAQAVHRHDLILKKLDTEIIAVKSTQEELKRLLDENNKKSFNLKDNDYEVKFKCIIIIIITCMYV